MPEILTSNKENFGQLVGNCQTRNIKNSLGQNYHIQGEMLSLAQFHWQLTKAQNIFVEKFTEVQFKKKV